VDCAGEIASSVTPILSLDLPCVNVFPRTRQECHHSGNLRRGMVCEGRRKEGANDKMMEQNCNTHVRRFRPVGMPDNSLALERQVRWTKGTTETLT